MSSRFKVMASITVARVTDTDTGEIREYFNPLSVAAAAITDTAAFTTCH